MTAFRKVQGDVNDSIIVVLDGVADLASATSVEAHVWRDDTAPTTLAASVVDPAARTVKIQLGGVSGWLATAEPEIWFIEEQVTFSDGTVLTWPAGQPDVLVVRADA